MRVQEYVGYVCAKARLRHGDPQWKVAQHLGTCQQTISNFERGRCDSYPVLVYYITWFLNEDDIKMIREGVRNGKIKTQSRSRKKHEIPVEPEVAGRSVDGCSQPFSSVSEGTKGDAAAVKSAVLAAREKGLGLLASWGQIPRSMSKPNIR